MIILAAGQLNRRVRIERPITASGIRGAGKGGWALVAIVWASVLDVPPSRTEQPDGGMPVATRRSRVRMRFRSDVTPAMRVVFGSRVMQIVGEAAELGRRSGIEFMTEEYSSPGNPA